jgi:hypothetical protein
MIAFAAVWRVVDKNDQTLVLDGILKHCNLWYPSSSSSRWSDSSLQYATKVLLPKNTLIFHHLHHVLFFFFST